MIYDATGAIATAARYENFANFGEVNFPTEIDIDRPKEEYSIKITIEKVEVNKPLSDDQFVLLQPSGAQVKVLK
jgi:outer membrane lipoprotein-sorting protein